MTRLCMVGYTYRGYPMAYALARAHEYGYDAVEVRDFADVDLSTPEGFERALEGALVLSCQHGVAVHTAFVGPLPISRAGERQREEETFARYIAIAGQAGLPLLHTHLGLSRPDGRGLVVSAEAREEDFQAVQSTLRRLIPLAERAGVRIALETHMNTIHDTVAAQLRILRAAASPWLVATPDPANMLITHPAEDLPRAIRELGPFIGYMHLKNLKLRPGGYDWNMPLATGDVNYYRVLCALQETGYQGPLAVEYCGTGDADYFARGDALYLRELLARVAAHDKG